MKYFLTIFILTLLLIPHLTFATVGASCTTDSQCAGTEYCLFSQCAAKFGNGASCDGNNGCTSNYCDPVTSTCQDNPAASAGGGTVASPGGGIVATTPGGSAVTLPNPLGSGVTNINIIIGRIIKYIVGISGSVALAVFVYGGIIWIISAGRGDYIEKGKKAIKMSVLGLVIIFTSYIIIRFIVEALESIG